MEFAIFQRQELFLVFALSTNISGMSVSIVLMYFEAVSYIGINIFDEPLIDANCSASCWPADL